MGVNDMSLCDRCKVKDCKILSDLVTNTWHYSKVNSLKLLLQGNYKVYVIYDKGHYEVIDCDMYESVNTKKDK